MLIRRIKDKNGVQVSKNISIRFTPLLKIAFLPVIRAYVPNPEASVVFLHTAALTHCALYRDLNDIMENQYKADEGVLKMGGSFEYDIGDVILNETFSFYQQS